MTESDRHRLAAEAPRGIVKPYSAAAAGSEVYTEFLASLAAELGGSAVLLEDIRAANTARHGLDLCWSMSR